MSFAKIKSVLTSVFGLLLIVACSAEKSNTLSIAVSANAQFAAKELINDFTTTSGIRCDLVVGSSGNLAAQIINGAPYDVFLSADMSYPQRVWEDGFAENPPVPYAQGKLILWSMADHVKLEGIKKLDPDQRIAIANPNLAPYGRAAIQVLDYYQLAIKEDKLVLGESVSQVNQFIRSKAVSCGFTSLSSVLSSGLKQKGIWLEIDSLAYDPIDQGMIVVKNNRKMGKTALQFYEYMLTKPARIILATNGYLINE